MNLHTIATLSDWPATAPIACLFSQDSGADLWGTMVDSASSNWDESLAEAGKKQVLHHDGRMIFCFGLGETPTLETCRKTVQSVYATLSGLGIEKIAIAAGSLTSDQEIAMAESAIMSNYRFSRHVTKPTPMILEEIALVGVDVSSVEIGEAFAVSTCEARDLVNEPANILTATRLAEESERLGKKYGFSVEVLELSKIQSLKMGGLLTVNAGSIEPPTFSILEYKPANPINEKPVILVGKGVVYDTGGLSLKPTPNSMDFMKCDMAGAAAVIGAICGVAALKSNVHVIGLVPATDNRPGLNAWAPGDITTMYDGTTVENMHSDAEGRMILADALAYAKQYDPVLVMDFATLTGAQVVAIGQPGMALMATASDEVVDAVQQAGEHTYERSVRLPLWQEYRDMLKSEIADLKNLGPSQGGAISAGKFLEHFTDYPWMHFDIAGPAWSPQPDSYRGQGGTGAGVRMLMRFFQEEGRQWLEEE